MTAAVVVAPVAGENLRLEGESPKRTAVQNAIAVPGKSPAVRVRRFRPTPLFRLAA